MNVAARHVAQILAALEAGRHADALRLARALFELHPEDEGALALLAASAEQAGQMDEALLLLRRLVHKHPQTWQHWNNLGNVERAFGHQDAALEAYRRALALQPERARLRANLGLLHLNRGEYRLAREQLGIACGLPGADAGMRVWAAVACHADGDQVAAQRLVATVDIGSQLSEEAQLELGWLLVQAGRFDEGERLLTRPYADKALAMRAAARRVLALERVNRLDAAQALLDALTVPGHTGDPLARQEALHADAVVALRRNDYAHARRSFEAALEVAGSHGARVPLWFGLAQACDRLDDIPSALAALTQAHHERAANADDWYPGAPHSGNLRVADAWLSREEAASLGTICPDDRAAPVFVVGFPRSGTTLVEQMLAAHPSFVSVDERPFVWSTLRRLETGGVGYPAALVHLMPQQLATLRQHYWSEADAVVRVPAGMRLVDKNPLNMLLLPLLVQLFPQATVIFCRRHPCDTILSCYLQDFRDPDLRAMCSSLERLATDYAVFDRQWQHHVEVLHPQLLELRYEDLVADPDTALGRIGIFLGIDKVAAMRNFQARAKARGFISTPSYAQVVEPLRTDAIDRWRRYIESFRALLPILQGAIVRGGYDA